MNELLLEIEPASPLHWPLSPLCTTDYEIFKCIDQGRGVGRQPFGAEDLIYRPRNNRKCRLRPFTTRDVTSCIDEIQAKSDRKWLHFAFIGDSRMRQQYLNMVKVIFEKIMKCDAD